MIIQLLITYADSGDSFAHFDYYDLLVVAAAALFAFYALMYNRVFSCLDTIESESLINRNESTVSIQQTIQYIPLDPELNNVEVYLIFVMFYILYLKIHC